MPDNLTINITATTDKARAELELLKAQLRATNKEIRALSTAGAKAGDTLPSKALEAASARAGVLNRQIQALNKTFTQTGSVMDGLATKSTRRLVTQFASLSRTAENLAMVVGGVTGSFAGGFLAAAAIRSLSNMVGLLGEAEKRLKEIRDTARSMGTTPLNLQAAQEAALRAGQSADVGANIVKGIREQLNKAATETKEQPRFDGVKVLRGSVAEAGEAAQVAAGKFNNLSGVVQNTVRVFKGGVPVMQDFTDPLKLIGVDPTKFKDTASDALRFQKAVAEGFKTLAASGRFGPTQLNELSKILFAGESAAATLKTIPELIKNWDAQLAELAKTARGVSDEQILKQEDLDKAKERVNVWFREFNAGSEQLRLSVGVTLNNMFADFLTVTLPAFKASFLQFFTDLGTAFVTIWNEDWASISKKAQEIYTEVTTAWQPIGTFFEQLGTDIMGAWDRAMNWIAEKARAVAAAVRSVLPGGSNTPAATAPPMQPMAGGGMIRGPGSGTSDSILARLSNGEFVMRAAAVNKWGPRFMAALNGLQNPFGYAGGGLVRRFAAGGMVTARASDGTTVNLHFPSGSSFALRGDAAIVAGLVREGRRAGMLNAGRLPGAFAA